jgi:hypothetical protein
MILGRSANNELENKINPVTARLKILPMMCLVKLDANKYRLKSSLTRDSIQPC